MRAAVQGGMLGLLAVTGIVLVTRRLPVLRRPRLDDRLAPYLRDAPRPSTLLRAERTVTPFPTLERLAAPFLSDGARLIERLLGGATSARHRLDRAGGNTTLEDFRAEQVVWGGAGLLGGLVASLALAARGAVSPVPVLLLCLLSTVAGVLARDHWLTRQVERREERMMAEFPTIAELLALAVAAGESPVAALDRVVRRSHGELSADLRDVLAEVRTGTPIARAFDDLAARSGLPAVSRFAEGIAIAMERGTPLTDVLHAQAGDVREAGRRALIESGARREVLMMVPVVFLVLPTVVVFAFWPGLVGLRLVVP
jgi:tight adherence protein C